MDLTFYLAALFIGATLVLFSALGGDADLDVDADLDLDADADVDADPDGETGGLEGWLPFTRMRFWVFSLFAVGLLGTLLKLVGELGAGAVLAIALGVGLPLGFAAERAVRALRSSTASTSVDRADFLGAQGQVLLPVSPRQPGQIRVRVRGREFDLEALADPDGGEETLTAEDPVLVYELRDDGVALVSRIR